MGARLIAVNCDCDYADDRLKANKLYSDEGLYKSIAKGKGNILYIPFASNTLGAAIRTLFLHLKSGKKVTVLFALRWRMNAITKLILGMSKADIITISQDSLEFFEKELSGHTIHNVKLGVDSNVFSSVNEEHKIELRNKYGFPLDKTVVLHVGHLKHGRNVDLFLDVDEEFHVVLVFSSVTEQDDELRNRLESKANIQIIDDYIKNIEEIYQASDIYVFPIIDENNSIDVPLSVLEAAGCNLKIISTPYKEVAFFEDVPGLKKVSFSHINQINKLLLGLRKQEIVSTRTIAIDYDWSNAVQLVSEIIDG
jgi:glycosyltransferase involved in cell wall biosynthesis